MSTSTDVRGARVRADGVETTAEGRRPGWLMISTHLVVGPDRQLLARRRGRCRRRPQQHVAPASARWRVSLPMLVVLLAPLTPATMITVGGTAHHQRLFQRRQQVGEGVRSSALTWAGSVARAS